MVAALGINGRRDLMTFKRVLGVPIAAAPVPVETGKQVHTVVVLWDV